MLHETDVPQGIGLAGTVLQLPHQGQRALLNLERIGIVAERVVDDADVPEARGNAGAIPQRLPQRQGPLVELERLRVVAERRVDDADVAERARDTRAIPRLLQQVQRPLVVLERLRVVAPRLLEDADVGEHLDGPRSVSSRLGDPTGPLPRGERPLVVRAAVEARSRLVQSPHGPREPAEPLRTVGRGEEGRRALFQAPGGGQRHASDRRAADAQCVDERRDVGGAERLQGLLDLPGRQRLARFRQPAARGAVDRLPALGGQVLGKALEALPGSRAGERLGRVGLAAREQILGHEPRVRIVPRGERSQRRRVLRLHGREDAVGGLLGRQRRGGLRRGRRNRSGRRRVGGGGPCYEGESEQDDQN